MPSFEFNQQPNTLPLVSQNPTPQHDQVKFRRSGSERLKDGAKALLRRVESIKSRRKKRQNREGVVISGPQILDLTHIHQKFEDLKCFDISTSVSNPTSPTPSTNKSPIFFMPDVKVRLLISSPAKGINIITDVDLIWFVEIFTIRSKPQDTHNDQFVDTNTIQSKTR